MADEIKPIEDPKSEVSITLTKEVSEKIEEQFRKLGEKLEEKQKAFKFHGSKTSEVEMSDTAKAKEAVDFIKAMATSDWQSATEIHNKRAPHVAEKAITIAGTAGSEYLVPTVFETEILATFDSYDQIIQDADVKTYNKPGYIFSLNELDTRTIVFFSDENSTGLTSSQPTFSNPQIAVTDMIGSTDITLDFLEDQETNIMESLSRQYAEEFAKKLQARLINGDVTVSGVVTKGVINSAGLNEVLIANPTSGYSSVTANDIENMFFDAISIDHFQDENQKGKFYMNATTLYNLRRNIRTSSSDRDYLSIFDSVQMTLMGKPLVLTNQMPTPATTTSNPFVLYGNLKNHLKIRRKRGITMKVNDSGTTAAGRQLNYQLGRELVVSQRIGHQVVLAEGLTVLAT